MTAFDESSIFFCQHQFHRMIFRYTNSCFNFMFLIDRTQRNGLSQSHCLLMEEGGRDQGGDILALFMEMASQMLSSQVSSSFLVPELACIETQKNNARLDCMIFLHSIHFKLSENFIIFYQQRVYLSSICSTNSYGGVMSVC